MGLHPDIFLTASILLSLHTSLRTHYKSLTIEKGFLSSKAKVIVLLWAWFATLRRVAGIVAFFTPSLGLLDLLIHWKYEQKPFRIRLEYARSKKMTQGDLLELHGGENHIVRQLWSERL